jgi:hypothetical protein
MSLKVTTKMLKVEGSQKKLVTWFPISCELPSLPVSLLLPERLVQIDPCADLLSDIISERREDASS